MKILDSVPIKWDNRTGKTSVTYYATARGDEPVREYVELLPHKERVKVRTWIDLLAEKTILGRPYAKKMKGHENLYELRPGAHRIFYCYGEGKIVLLHAFRKKSNETPQNEIETAFKRMRGQEA